MIRAAMYARYSSEHQKESSIEDQARTCEQYAARHGWTITHRYADRAISGATAERPEYQRMLADAKAKAFDILLVNDFSRLSRDMDETEQTRKKLVYWGVRLIGVMDGIDTSQKGHRLHSRVKGMLNEEYLEKLKDDIKRGMVGQAQKRYWQGGRVYGYRLVPELDPTRKDCYGQPARIGTRLEPDPGQAHWVRWIFEEYAQGQSTMKIVEELNRRGVPSPGAAYKRRYQKPPCWSIAALYGDPRRGTGLLNNPLYVGRYV
jgi:DNA invertase Pin-like site-specific DNA recombinase